MSEILFDLSGYTIEWAVGLPHPKTQRDAMFYCNPMTPFVCTVKKGNFSVDIYCDGETRVNVHQYAEICRSGGDLVEAGIDCDEKLVDEQGLTVVNNSWFDLYETDTGEHLDYVTHQIQEAIASAVEWLDEQEAKDVA